MGWGFGEGGFQLFLGFGHRFHGGGFLAAEFADDAGGIGEGFAEAVDLSLEGEGVVWAGLEDGEGFAGFREFVFEGEGAFALALVGLGGVGIEGIDRVAGFFQLGFEGEDAFLVGFQAVLGIGQLAGGFFVGCFGDGFCLEGFQVVFQGFLGGFGFGEGVFEFFHAFAGGEIIGRGGFVGGIGGLCGGRGVVFFAKPPSEEGEEGGGGGEEWEKFDEKPEVACVHSGVWMMELRVGLVGGLWVEIGTGSGAAG